MQVKPMPMAIWKAILRLCTATVQADAYKVTQPSPTLVKQVGWKDGVWPFLPEHNNPRHYMHKSFVRYSLLANPNNINVNDEITDLKPDKQHDLETTSQFIQRIRSAQDILEFFHDVLAHHGSLPENYNQYLQSEYKLLIQNVVNTKIATLQGTKPAGWHDEILDYINAALEAEAQNHNMKKLIDQSYAIANPGAPLPPAAKTYDPLCFFCPRIAKFLTKYNLHDMYGDKTPLPSLPSSEPPVAPVPPPPAASVGATSSDERLIQMMSGVTEALKGLRKKMQNPGKPTPASAGNAPPGRQNANQADRGGRGGGAAGANRAEAFNLKRKCKNCQAEDHSTNNCRQPATPTLKCTVQGCGGQGHFNRDCPLRNNAPPAGGAGPAGNANPVNPQA
jgi:hypothetical protein